jgi:hypothetical protein
VTGLATGLMTRFTSKTGTCGAVTSNVDDEIDHHFHGHDIAAAMKEITNLLKADGTHKPPKTPTMKLDVPRAAVLSGHCPIVVIQGAESTRLLKKALEGRGAQLLEPFFKATGSSAGQCQLGLHFLHTPNSNEAHLAKRKPRSTLASGKTFSRELRDSRCTKRRALQWRS